MKNNNIARMVISGICLVLSILWMCEIYLLSDKVADDSAKQSMGIGRIVAELVVAGFDDMTEQEQLEVLEKLDFPVRKAAHMTEYAILGFLFTGSSLWMKRGKRPRSLNWLKRFAVLLAVIALYAASDEIHQYFVPGRACLLRDVFIDALGGAAGILVAMAVGKFYSNIFCRRREKVTY